MSGFSFGGIGRTPQLFSNAHTITLGGRIWAQNRPKPARTERHERSTATGLDDGPGA